eukprot:TRINITY_DN14452_c1_g3_i1.p1 TRINITY_DN14452_c1_g3~~TRINITY_DN14452_c1_g3_i1.p1  ORF type:complete len:282 (-),score=64.82 TRINITY_DN14452_c1_g3_i1:168-1013(-)
MAKIEEHPLSEAETHSGSLSSTENLEQELLRSNRKLAQVRDLLSQREKLVQSWHHRYVETTGRLKDAESEMSKLRAALAQSKDEARRNGDDQVSQHSRSQPSKVAPKGDIERLQFKLVTERSSRVAAEAHLKESTATCDALEKQVLQLSEELKQARSEIAASADAKRKERVTDNEAVAKLQARCRILQAENTALRSEAGSKRCRSQEIAEGAAMAAEEVRTWKAQASKLKLQLEECRRARAIEMDALVKQMSVMHGKSSQTAPHKVPQGGIHRVQIRAGGS